MEEADDPSPSVGTKNPLIIAAEKIPAARATHAGWLQKHSSNNRWSKRYFLILPSAEKRGVSFLVYYKSAAPNSPMLAAMDLSQAGDPAMVPRDADETGTGALFGLQWDKYRRFRASGPEEAARWVASIAAAQGRKGAAAGRGAAGGYQSGGASSFGSPAAGGSDWGASGGGGQKEAGCCCSVQ